MKNSVRGVVMKNHLVFPFVDEHILLLKARIAFPCVKLEYRSVVRELLAKQKIQLVTKDWSEVGPQLIANLAAKTGAKQKRNQFLIYNENEDVVSEAITTIRETLSRFRINVTFRKEARSVSKTGKLLRAASDKATTIHVGLMTFKFDPDQELIGSMYTPISTSTLTLGGRAIILSRMQKQKSLKEDALHIRLSSINSDGTEIEVLSSFDTLMTPETKLSLRAFALDVLNRLT